MEPLVMKDSAPKGMGNQWKELWLSQFIVCEKFLVCSAGKGNSGRIVVSLSWENKTAGQGC